MKPPLRDRAEMLIIAPALGMKKILLITDDRGLYAFPGGGIDEGETPEQAAVREALEEAGAYVKHIKDPGVVYKKWGCSGYKRDGTLYGGSRTHFFIGDFDKPDLSFNGGVKNFKLEWLEPLEAIRVICFNNWRYHGPVIQPILEKALT